MMRPVLTESLRGVGLLAQLLAVAIFTSVAVLTPPVGIVAGAGVLALVWHLAPLQHRASVLVASCAGVLAAVAACLVVL